MVFVQSHARVGSQSGHAGIQRRAHLQEVLTHFLLFLHGCLVGAVGVAAVHLEEGVAGGEEMEVVGVDRVLGMSLDQLLQPLSVGHR